MNPVNWREMAFAHARKELHSDVTDKEFVLTVLAAAESELAILDRLLAPKPFEAHPCDDPVPIAQRHVHVALRDGVVATVSPDIQPDTLDALTQMADLAIHAAKNGELIASETRAPKRCPGCQRDLPPEMFRQDLGRRDALSSRCSECLRAADNARRAQRKQARTPNSGFTCERCGGKFQAQGGGRWRVCPACKERKEKDEEPAAAPTRNGTAHVVAPAIASVQERIVKARLRYRDHMDAGGRLNSEFEAGLADEYGLNRTQVMAIRDDLMDDLSKTRTTICQECKEPFKQRSRETRTICDDCAETAKEARIEMRSGRGKGAAA